MRKYLVTMLCFWPGDPKISSFSPQGRRRVGFFNNGPHSWIASLLSRENGLCIRGGGLLLSLGCNVRDNCLREISCTPIQEQCPPNPGAMSSCTPNIGATFSCTHNAGEMASCAPHEGHWPPAHQCRGSSCACRGHLLLEHESPCLRPPSSPYARSGARLARNPFVAIFLATYPGAVGAQQLEVGIVYRVVEQSGYATDLLGASQFGFYLESAFAVPYTQQKQGFRN